MKIRKISPNRVNRIEISYSLKQAVEILKRHNNQRLYDTWRIPPGVLDYFLFNGRFNSVLGLEGFKIFKDKLRDVIKRVNDEDFGANYVNLDEMYEALLDSGVYYMDEYLSSELEFLKSDQRWLTAYRYIATNFPGISYQDFKTIKSRFEDSRGYSFYVEPQDSDFLQAITEKSGLFREVIDFKATLLQLDQKGLREICSQLGIQSARSLTETANRILEAAGDKIVGYLPQSTARRRSLVIQDQELATGSDIIRLDKYLYALAKVIRADLGAFIDARRRGTLHKKIVEGAA